MSIKVSETKKVAKLAKLKFSDEEIEAYTNDLNSIVEFCEKINEIDTSTLDDNIHPEAKMPERTDVCFQCDPSVMNNAPEKICNMFAVPKVIE